MAVAWEREAAQKRLTFESVQALFSTEGAQAFLNGLQRVEEIVRAEQRRQRGETGALVPEARRQAARDLSRIFAKAGVRPGGRRPPRPGKGKR